VKNPILNALTIDLEDYYMVSAFESVVKREDWHKYESRIERNTHRILEILAEAKPPSTQFKTQNSKLKIARDAAYNSPPDSGVRATFFCLGWIADKYPGLIREITACGHEIANHGYDHNLVYNMTSSEFREDVRKSKKILEDAAGKEVVGYRAPSYSITAKSLWALPILAEEGYRYDSSIFPIHHDRYGIPDAPRFPFLVDLDGVHGNREVKLPDFDNVKTVDASMDASNGRFIVEYPISTVKLWGLNMPISGGGYMRLFPYGVTKKGLEKINKDEEKPFVIYLHPWELDPEQPRFNDLSALSRFRHYVNLDGTAEKLRRLLSDFTFSSMREVIGLE
jgi:polysaccharide deacetylase family protein (PEP-CTERM system associated)